MAIKEEESIGTMGVDKRGNLFYGKKFVDSLSVPEMKGVLCHESMHVALQHFVRLGKKSKDRWNIAADIVINNMIIQNGLSLPKGGFIPKNDQITVGGVKIEKISDKTANEVYKLLPEVKNKGFDIHIYVDGGAAGKGASKGEGKEGTGGISIVVPTGDAKDIKDDKNWEDIIIEAWTHAQLKGNTPAGMQRLVDAILKPQIPWYAILREFITRELPVDWNWGYPSKRAIATGIYLPGVKRENLEIVTTIDTSGSISKKILTRFVSELIAIVNSSANCRATVLIGDAKIHEIIPVENGNLKKLREAAWKGGGGTDHRPFYEWIKKNKPNCKVVINLTDGYTTYPGSEIAKTLWILVDSTAEPPFGKVIRIKE